MLLTVPNNRVSIINDNRNNVQTFRYLLKSSEFYYHNMMSENSIGSNSNVNFDRPVGTQNGRHGTRIL